MSIDTLPRPTTSATAEPDMPAKMIEVTTLTWPRPPRSRPTSATHQLVSRSEIVPAFMKLAETMNSGTASSTKLS
jgi:hypothetical protein